MLNNLLQSKKKNTGEIVSESPEPDFIPYACHYDGDTILTKSGELLQIIKVTGFSGKSVGSEHMDLRQMVRQAVMENVLSDDFALWFHTVRRKKNLDPGGEFQPGFSSELNKNWKEKHRWDETYVNEVYITILRDGEAAKITDFSNFMKSLYFGVLQKSHENFLKESHKALIGVVDGMLETLAPFGVERLTVHESHGVYYSDQLQFFAKILNLAEMPMPVPICDLSENLASNSIAVGFNTLEVKGETGKHFGVLFTLKEYHELPAVSLDKILQLQQEFIITQTLDFINVGKAMKGFKRQKYLLQTSGDDELSEAIGLDYIINSDDGSPTSFGDSQISIFLMDSDLKRLEKNVEAAADVFRNLGVLAIRRDLRLEECFWAQLPGNFAFLSRKKPISTSLVGGFASLYNFPAGKRVGNLWGPAVTMFHTANSMPYFFNFHVGDNGHTSIIGPLGMGKTVLLNFLVSESQKFNGRLFFFDRNRASNVFIKSIGGYYAQIDPSEASAACAFNPLQIPDSPENREFIRDWLILLSESSGVKASETERSHFAKLAAYIFGLPQEQRRLSMLANSFGPVAEGSLGERMSHWYGQGKYAHLFDNDAADTMSLSDMIYGFDMSHVVEDGVCTGPILFYLLHHIEILLDGRPTIIVLDEAWDLVNNDIFAPSLKERLGRFRKKNAVVIFAAENVPNDAKNSMTKTVTESIATQIFLPNLDADKSSMAYKRVWGLSDEEFKILSKMRIEKRHFMLKQEGESVVAMLDLAGFEEVKILSGDEKTAILMDDVIAKTGNDPADWLPVFYEESENEVEHAL